MSVSRIELEISAFIPPRRDQHDLHPDIFFTALVPNFHDRVKFALIEVLELDREKSKAQTWVYFEKSQDDFKTLVQEYFSQIGALFNERGFSMSSADEFYFGNRVLFSRIDNIGIAPVTCNDLKWVGPHLDNLDRDPQKRDNIEFRAVQEAYDEYVLELSQTLLKTYPVSYVLLVPVVLNHFLKTHQRKIGAAFLHFGLNEPLESDQLGEIRFAQNVFQAINLYWHYHLTAESLHKQIELAESAKAELRGKTVAEEKLRLDQDRYQNKVLPALKSMKAAIELVSIHGSLIAQHVNPSSEENAKEALLELSKIMLAFFPAGNKFLHDPWGHPNLNALEQDKDKVLTWATLFITSLDNTDVFKETNIARSLLSPITDHLQESGGKEVTNNSQLPHPALCLAKCIANARIPLAWFLVALGYLNVTEDHWRRYLKIDGRLGFSVMDVIYAIGFITTNKLSLTSPKLTMEGNSVVIDLTPKFKNYKEFFTSMESGLQLESPSGGTAKRLVQLIKIGYQVEIKPLVKKGMEAEKLPLIEQDVQCKISVSQECVQFKLLTCLEETGQTPETNF